MSKIKKITVSNLKAVSALTADFNGCTAIVTGGNNKGKSSFLKALPERLQGIKPEQVLKRGESEGFSELELTTGEKFVWTFKSGGKEKLTYISERNIPGSVTKEISKIYFPAVFDVDSFLNSPPAKQKKVLQELTGIDFTEIDKKYKEAFEARTYINKRVVEEKAKLGYVDPKLPTVPTPIDELEKELNGIAVHNLKFKQVSDGVAAKQSQSEEFDKEISELYAKMRTVEEKKALVLSDIEKGQAWLIEPKHRPKINAIELQEKIANIKADNLAIEENNKAIAQQKEFEKVTYQAEEANDEVKAIEAEKLDVIKNASMPDGFGFSDEGITYEGFAFNKETLSSSRVYIAALKLAAIGLGDVKTLHFDASFLDKNSLADIEKWANEMDLQLLIERPDFDGGEIEYQLVATPV